MDREVRLGEPLDNDRGARGSNYGSCDSAAAVYEFVHGLT